MFVQNPKVSSCINVYYLRHYRNVKSYINQRNFGSFGVDLFCANKYRI